MKDLHLGQVIFEEGGNRFGKGGYPVSCSFPGTSRYLRHLVINILYPEPDGLCYSKTAAVEEFDDQLRWTCEKMDDLAYFLSGQHDRYVHLSGGSDRIDPGFQGSVQNPFVEKDSAFMA